MTTNELDIVEQRIWAGGHSHALKVESKPEDQELIAKIVFP